MVSELLNVTCMSKIFQSMGKNFQRKQFYSNISLIVSLSVEWIAFFFKSELAHHIWQRRKK